MVNKIGQMSGTRLGFLSIGQSPRPDLVPPLAALAPGIVPLEAGALDDVAEDEIPTADESSPFPLTTRLRSGRVVEVDEQALLPLLARGLDRLERAGVAATLLLCAGTFAGLVGARPLFAPFSIARTYLEEAGFHRLMVVCPLPGQVAPMEQRWLAAGFSPTVKVLPSIDPADTASDLAQLASDVAGYDCLVLDYVGHPPALVRGLQAALLLPVVDLGLLAAETLFASLGWDADDV